MIQSSSENAVDFDASVKPAEQPMLPPAEAKKAIETPFYLYVRNDPVNLVDPTGLAAFGASGNSGWANGKSPGGAHSSDLLSFGSSILGGTGLSRLMGAVLIGQVGTPAPSTTQRTLTSNGEATFGGGGWHVPEYKDSGSVHPNDFLYKWTEGRKEMWWNQRFGPKGAITPHINRAAEKYGVPRDLLQFIVANEMIDYGIEDWEPLQLGSSLGPAQVEWTSSLDHNAIDRTALYDFARRTATERVARRVADSLPNPSAPDRENFVKTYLYTPEGSIDTAAAMNRLFMRDIEATARGQWKNLSPSFLRDASRGVQASDYFFSEKKDIVNSRTPTGVIMGFVAVWQGQNTQDGILWDKDVMTRPGGAFDHAANAGALVDLVRKWEKEGNWAVYWDGPTTTTKPGSTIPIPVERWWKDQ